MILDKEIKIKKKGNNKLLYYKELGYDVSDDFFVKPVLYLNQSFEMLKRVQHDKLVFCG